MGRVYENERPNWCPHTSCEFRLINLDLMCVGKLPKPEPHDGDFNTHRLCLYGVLPNDEIFDLQVNKTDVWWFERLFAVIKDDDEMAQEALEE